MKAVKIDRAGLMSDEQLKNFDAKLTVTELAQALYNGYPHLQNLAEKLARHHSRAGMVAPFEMRDALTHNFWCAIATQLIDHASNWNPGPSLDEREAARLETMFVWRSFTLELPMRQHYIWWAKKDKSISLVLGVDFSRSDEGLWMYAMPPAFPKRLFYSMP